ncbi:MAG: 1-(5-phosphoribosyl)-5-[(5-phosphoribosylamino)methylideneamino]imidazole-4-carboxamide isomerase [candidate division KSB1 bacterium]|nr:1-(5-phosphoribosyl)-5-[(5-phosphoribosylamino)methylideneamino]imidazole-4-carboxamide isomerase [candidate division KSB1 bacterium]
MIVFPAIDLLDGNCVRLVEGKREAMTVYSDSPIAVARRWESAGASWVHVVDLNAAFGFGDNRDIVREICAETSLKVQLGGGLRTTDAVQKVRELGVRRVVVGTAAVRRPDWIAELVAEFGADTVAAALDLRDGLVAIRGWEEQQKIPPLDLAQKWAQNGLRHLVYTDIRRDGKLIGPDVEGAVRLAQLTGLGITVSGGIGTMDDLRAVLRAADVLEGVIIGKAIYEGAIDLAQALQLVRTGSQISE